LSNDSDQSGSSDDESCNVDNDDAQTESGVHESTQSNSVDESTKSSSQHLDDVKGGDVAPPTISNSKPENNDIKQTTPQHGVKTPKKAGSRKKEKRLDRRITLKVHNHKYLVSLVVKKTSQAFQKNSLMEKVKKTSNIQRTSPTPPDIVHDRQMRKIS
jgi:hypothetical protein